MKNFKQKKTKFIIGIFLFLLFIIINNKIYARSYSIDKMNIKATVLKDGSLNIEQSITYNFKGQYNGIYITIPYVLNDTQREKINGIKNNDIYTGNSTKVNSITDSNNKIYKENIYTNYRKSSSNGEYEITKDDSKYTIKVYSTSYDTVKTFILDYNISNVCINYSDTAELYYNFIGGKWDVDINNLNIDIYLPDNKTSDDLYAYGHGPYEGITTIISANQINFKVPKVKRNEYVAARIAFNKDNISDSRKIVNEDKLNTIRSEENDIYNNILNKKKSTKKILIISGVLFVYWIVLLVIYEKDKKYVTTYVGEEELFEKYNPLLAGCIQGNREILARDIIAVILRLIDKKIIKMEIQNAIVEKKELYKYKLKKNQNKCEMDEIEKYIYDWFFDGKEVQELSDRLKELPKEKEASKKFKQLNEMAKKKLNSIGANNNKVPIIIRVFNTILFIVSTILAIIHIQYNGLSIYGGSDIINNLVICLEIGVILIPIAAGLLYIPINLLITTRHQINKIVRKFTGQKIVTTSISIILIFLVIVFITSLITTKAKYIMADEVLIGIALLIMLTDNLMLQNNVEIIEDYSRLNMIKTKLEDDDLFKDRNVEQVLLWEQYLSYAVAFGVSSKIIKKIKEINIDSDLEKLIESNKFLDYTNSGYYEFYKYASLDSRFLKSYGDTCVKAYSTLGSGSDGGRRSEEDFLAAEDFLAEVAEAGGRRRILKCNKEQKIYEYAICLWKSRYW